MDPFSMLSVAMQIGGGLFSAAGAIKKGNAENKQAQANAAEIERAAKVNYDRDMRDIRFSHGRLRAATAANGLQMAGSPGAVMRSNDMHMMADANENLYRAQHEAAQVRKTGKAQRLSGYLSAGSSLIDAGGSLFGSMSGRNVMSSFRPTSSPTLQRNAPGGRYPGMQYF